MPELCESVLQRLDVRWYGTADRGDLIIDVTNRHPFAGRQQTPMGTQHPKRKKGLPTHIHPLAAYHARRLRRKPGGGSHTQRKKSSSG